ncbi:29 kDa ribonucleoprotein A, chloroplastic [Corylus avellana]|uniref:29 kDa ribonucleoprotein A, chloroplastic n=1 Tax=Corylus avellana TaxID=13451 RepID=UPI00286D30E2|nr:29 kDa ribonucleoprotein A, chloroplastic [Corylus avellana]
MAAIEAALSIFPVYSSSSSSSQFPLTHKQLPSIKLRVSSSFPYLFRSFTPSRHTLVLHKPTRSPCFELCSALQEAVVEEIQEQSQEPNPKRKLYVVNLPWSLSVVDIKNLFGECGTVKDVEIIKQKDGKHRGFAFVTMASAEEAQAVIDKFDSHEISGRAIRIEFAKRFKKPSPPRPEGPPAGETRHKLYVSNLAWKARSTHLREFVSENFKPVSARVVFDAPLGRSAGYGFVSFATREEAEAVISALDGKELMGRPLRLKFSQTTDDEAGSEKEEGTQTNDDEAGSEKEEDLSEVQQEL